VNVSRAHEILFAGTPAPPNRSTTLDSMPDAELAAHVRADNGTVYHPVRTMRMGVDNDPLAAMDSNRRVKGVAGLRVADASAMPSLIRGHTMASSVFIGYRAADHIARRE
jgi:choline dehydrogenase